jgi:hypothetical protein
MLKVQGEYNNISEVVDAYREILKNKTTIGFGKSIYQKGLKMVGARSSMRSESLSRSLTNIFPELYKNLNSRQLGYLRNNWANCSCKLSSPDFVKS